MCGFVGIIGKSTQEQIIHMRDSLSHRGPDEATLVKETDFSLGFQRLAIVDLEKGQQPVYSQSKNTVSVFNGEIYNHQALREKLLDKGCQLESTHSDSEIIPNLYEVYGLDFITDLDGMFAIAIYDKKKQTTYLIRDRVGKKPLYYSTRKQQLYFASEIKALKVINFGNSHSPEALINYLQKKNSSAPGTFYSDIRQVNPGHFVTFQNKQIKSQRYWDIKFENSYRYPDTESAIEALEEKLISAVQKRFSQDVPFGSFLSGGLDSSLITSLIRKKYSGPLKTFTLCYESSLEKEHTGKSNDRLFARQLSQKLGSEHYEYELRAREVFDSIDKTLQAFDEPFSGVTSTYFLCSLVKQHLKVIISGDGADEIFGSYLTHRLSTQEHKNENWRDELNVFNQKDLSQLLNNFVPQTTEEHKIKFDSELHKTLDLEFKDQLPNQILAFVDRLSMAHGVETRCPYLDQGFLELACQLDSQFRIKNGETKYILKKLAEKYLPKELIYRPKEGFVLPVFNWMQGTQKSSVIESILDTKYSNHFDLNQKYIQQLVQEWQQKPEGQKHHKKIWNLYILSRFFHFSTCFSKI